MTTGIGKWTKDWVQNRRLPSMFCFLRSGLRRRKSTTPEKSGNALARTNSDLLLTKTNSDLLNMCKLRYDLKAKEHHEDLSSYQIEKKKNNHTELD